MKDRKSSVAKNTAPPIYVTITLTTNHSQPMTPLTLLINLWTAVTYLPQAAAVLWHFGGKFPQAFAVINGIRAVLGSEQFLKLLELIGVAIKEAALPDPPPDTEPARQRLLGRVLRRFALNCLGMTETQYVAFCDINGVAGPMADELTA